MRNKLSVVLFTVFFFVVFLSTSLSYAADNLHPKTTFSVDRAPKFMIPFEPAGTHPDVKGSIPLGLREPPPTNSPGNRAGLTYYDYQHNGSMNRQVAINQENGVVFFVWMAQDDTVIPGARGIKYQAYDSYGIYSDPPGTPGYLVDLGGLWGTTEYSGYTACEFSPRPSPEDPTPASFVCHTDPQQEGYRTVHYYDGLPDNFIWYENHLFADQALSCYSVEVIWPVMSVHHGDSSNVSQDVIYVLSHVWTDNESLVLYRKVGTTWDNGQCLENVTDLAYSIIADPNSDYVVAVYTDDRGGLGEGAGGQTDLDVYFQLSTDQGATWGTQVNVSNYTEDTLWRAYSDLSAMIDPNRQLHIIAPVRELRSATVYENNKSRLVHWRVDLTETPPTISKAHVIDEARYIMKGGINGADCDPDAWNLYIAKPSISLCEGKMYALFTKFGDDNEPGALYDCSQLGFANGELYLAGSDDYGDTWDTAWNLTETRTPQCDSAECESDHWSSMARYGMFYEAATDTLDIMYINDKDAGGIPQGSGTWCVNNVMHYRFPCRGVDHIPKVSLEPNEFGDPLHTAPGVALEVPLKISNIGNAILNVSGITVEYIDIHDPAWISVGTFSPTVATNSYDSVTITFNAGGTIDTLNGDPDPSGWEARILIDSDAPSDVDTVFVHLTVASDFNIPETDTLYTTTRALSVSNTGNLGGGGEDGVTLDIAGDCDADLTAPNGDVYLFDASPMIVWNDGLNRSYTSVFTQIFTEDGTFRPQSDLLMSGGADYNMAQCTVSTTDSIFGVGVTLWAPTDGNDFVIAQYDFTTWKPGLKGMNQVYVGMVLDWDIPADNAVDNQSGYNETLNTIWQQGGQTSTTDEDAPHSCPVTEDNRYGGIAVLASAPLNAWTALNATMQQGSGFNTDSLYAHVSDAGYNTSPDAIDTAIDLHTGVTFEMVDMTAKATYTYVVALVTTNAGLVDYTTQVEAAAVWAEAHGIISTVCDCNAADANNDAQVNLGDAVSIINFVFKGGDAPAPYVVCSGDANNDCQVNLGDAVSIINFVFKGGTPPPTCEAWTDKCGSYE